MNWLDGCVPYKPFDIGEKKEYDDIKITITSNDETFSLCQTIKIHSDFLDYCNTRS